MTRLLLVCLLACGGAPAANSPDRCAGEHPAPTIHARNIPASGGANAWFEIGASHVEGDEHVLLDGADVPIVHVTGNADDDHAMDATAGQLQPKSSRNESAAAKSGHIVGFRIPAGTPAGSHALSFRTCGATAAEIIAYDVLPNAAPLVTGVRVVKGAVWSSIVITGANLASAEEVVLVAADGAQISLPNVTRVDDGQLKAAAEKSGTYDVFVRSPNGLGGGPPGGAVVIR